LPALVENLHRGLPLVLIVGNGGIATGDGPGLGGCGQQQARTSSDSKILVFHGVSPLLFIDLSLPLFAVTGMPITANRT
jgi:hypothetical protein